jgi:tetratricopeptide (TPR) repeat protein
MLALEPESVEALFMLASGWLAAGDTQQALAYLGRVSAKEPASLRVAELEARALIAARDFDALERALAAAEKRKVFDERRAADFYYEAGLILLADGRRPEATRLLVKAEERWPTSGKVLRALAELAVATGRDKDACSYYGRLVELFPDSPDIDELRNALSVLQEKTGTEQ